MDILAAYPDGRPNVVVRGQKGFKTDLHWYEKPTDMFAQKCGHATTFRNVVDPGSSLDFMDAEQARTEAYFRAPFAPQEEGIAKTAIVHSISAYYLSVVLADNQKAEAFAAMGYQAIFMFNPHLGNRHHDYFSRRAYSGMLPNYQVGTTHFERALVKKPLIHKDDGSIGYGQNLPYHGQGLLFWQCGKKLIKQLEKQDGFSDAVSHIPVFVIRGSADEVNSKKKEKRFAAAIGADVEKFNTGHNAFLDCSEAQSWYAHKTAELAGTPAPFQQHAYSMPAQFSSLEFE